MKIFNIILSYFFISLLVHLHLCLPSIQLFYINLITWCFPLLYSIVFYLQFSSFLFYSSWDSYCSSCETLLQRSQWTRSERTCCWNTGTLHYMLWFDEIWYDMKWYDMKWYSLSPPLSFSPSLILSPSLLFSLPLLFSHSYSLSFTFAHTHAHFLNTSTTSFNFYFSVSDNCWHRV